MIAYPSFLRAISSTIHSQWRRVTTALHLPLLLVIGVGIAMATDFERVLGTLQHLGGSETTYRAWEKLLADSRPLNAMEKLKRINEFFNRRIQSAEDQQIWGQSDYWATPMETLAKGRGDCEDFTIAKYFTLLNAGVQNEQLRLVYVRARIGGSASKVVQAHMVLAYYPTPDAEPLILDNLITELRPAARRPDLQPVFSFNSQGIWQGAGPSGARGPGGTGNLTRWEDLLKRTRAEGFD